MRLRFLIDEDLPRSTAKVLAAAGYEALDVRDLGLRGAKDHEILVYALQNEAIIVSADVGFGSLVYLSSLQHHGFVLLRLPNELSVEEVNDVLIRALHTLSPQEITGSIVVIDQQKIRLRRKRL